MGKHAIIVIKNNNNEYLQYFDQRWNSFLFLNCKLGEKIDSNIIVKYISEILNLDSNNIKCDYIGEKVHTKFSESAKKIKEYDHFIFRIEFNNEPHIMKKKKFSLNDIKYKWYSYNELINDDRIKKVNSDIVSFVKELNL